MGPKAPQLDINSRKPRAVLTARDIARLRADTMCADGTIRKWANGEKVREATAHRLDKAAERLGIA